MTLWTAEAKGEVQRQWAAGFPASVICSSLTQSLGVPITRNAVLGLIWRTRHGRGAGLNAFARHPQITKEPPPLVPASPPNEPDPSTRKTIMELGNEHCRWPCGDPQEPGFLYCGDPSADLAAGISYCCYHWRMSRRAA